MPAMQAVLAQWSPPMDRTIMAAFTYSGEFSSAGPGDLFEVSTYGQDGNSDLRFQKSLKLLCHINSLKLK